MTTPVQVGKLLANVPAELQAMTHWVVWAPVQGVDKNGDPKILKEPRRSRDPVQRASTTDPTTWSTFEDAIDACRQFPGAIGGIGFVFTYDCGYVGIDVDTLSRVLDAFLVDRERFEARLDEKLLSYCELSPSGKGKHFIIKAKLPGTSGSPKWSDIQMELYGWSCFLTFTGDVIDGKHKIRDEQAFLDTIRDLFGAGHANRDGDELTDESVYRRTDLSDEEVMERAFGRPEIRARYEGLADCQPSMWTKTAFNSVVSELDKVTGSVEQIRKIVFASPMVTQSPPSNRKESRPAKARRLFESTLAQARGGQGAEPKDLGNNHILYGRQMHEAMEAKKKKRQEESMAEAARIAEETFGKLSTTARDLLEYFPLLSTEHKLLIPPPGVLGQFVEAARLASRKPFLKFAIPTTLAVLSGMLGRKYKVDNDGLNLHFLLAAGTGTGKTVGLEVWGDFLDIAASKWPGKIKRRRIIDGDANSIQGVIDEIQDAPSCLWSVDEADGQLKQMMESTFGPYLTLKKSFNKLYNSAKHTANFSAPRSRNGNTLGNKPIPNCCVSTLFAMPIDDFDVAASSSSDGFLSRLCVIRHRGPTVRKSRNMLPLPKELYGTLFLIQQYADQLDDEYLNPAGNPKSLLVNVSFEQVRQLVEDLDSTTEELEEKTQKDPPELPKHYVVVNRLSQTAMRIAALCAVLDNPYKPAVTEEQYRWAFGYLLQNLAPLLSDMDVGELGQSSQDGVKAVVREFLKLSRKKEFKSGIPKGDLRRALKDSKAFKDYPQKADRAITETLKIMEDEGQLKLGEPEEHGVRRYTPIKSASCWKQGGAA